MCQLMSTHTFCEIRIDSVTQHDHTACETGVNVRYRGRQSRAKYCHCHLLSCFLSFFMPCKCGQPRSVAVTFHCSVKLPNSQPYKQRENF